MKLGVVVLAAGKGTRMRSQLPKVLHPLAGRPLLAHVLNTAHDLDAEQICVVYGHGGEQVPNALSPHFDCAWVEQAKRLGTGHAVMQAMPSMVEVDRVLVLYGDVPLITSITLRNLIEAARSTSLGILTMRLPNPAGYGRIVRDSNHRVQRIVEQKDASEAELAIDEINTGFLVAERASLDDWLARIGNDNAQGEYYLTDVIGLATEDGVNVASAEPNNIEEVSGINNRVQLAALERFHQRDLAEQLMYAGVTMIDPDRIDIRGSLAAAGDVTIDVNCVFEGTVVLGEGVSIGPNCLLKDCTIGAGTQVFANCVIESARVGANALVGPFARLRPDAELADQVHVGNFVEIKKSTVGLASKVNHLTYVGDSEIGSGVNLGAGTITCNYDGANKHKTIIGDRAFIGSNTALVAPVEVGEGATIGAGSVITKPAVANELTLARAKQMTLTGWKRPVKKPK